MSIKNIITRLQCKRFGIKYFKNSWIHPTAKFLGSGEIVLSEEVQLHAGVILDCDEHGKIQFGKETNINSYSRIESMNSVIFEDHVLVGPNVYISDRNHEYRDVAKPIMHQGYYSHGGVFIGTGSWLGIHSAIIGNIHIGKHCVIGANSIVTESIPDFSVVVGNPARIVKQYDCEQKIWEKKYEII